MQRSPCTLERSLVRPFVLTAGDEVQGLLREPARIVATVP